MDSDQLRLASTDPAEFRRILLIDTDAGPRPLADVVDPWQDADFVAQDLAWQRIAGQDVQPSHTRFWIERPRGHSKTSDLAVGVTWALTFSSRRLSGVAAAADRDQARLLRDAIARLALANEWLGATLDVQQNRVVNTRTESELEILTSDVGSSYGILPDFIVADEICHWRNRDLWDSLLSSAAKRQHCLLIGISNAGFVDGWQWKTREAIRQDPSWHFSRLDGPEASWISTARLAEQRRLLPSFQYRRLWLNEWTQGTDNPLVTEDDLASAICLDVPAPGFPPEYAPYVGGLDIGTRADHTAFCVIACNIAGERMRLAYLQTWDPTRWGGKLPLSVVEREIVPVAKDARLAGVAYDPYEAALLAERLAGEGVPMYRFPWSAESKKQMALNAIECFTHRRIDLYADDALVRDLRRTQIIERADRLTFRLPTTQGQGHGDAAAAFLMALDWAAGTRKDYHRGAPQEHYARLLQSQLQSVS